jgi:hypothetical protein
MRRVWGGLGCWFEEGEFVVPADGVGCACLRDEVDEVGAAAEDYMLGVDGFVEGGVGVGVGAASYEGAAFEEDYGSAFGG